MANVGESTMRHYIKAQKVQVARFGRRVLVNRDRLRAALEEKVIDAPTTDV